MLNTSDKLSCLYYPFSRLLDDETLKYLLLIFDSITFMDDVDSDWRAVQLKRMAKENKFYASFEKLSDDYDMLNELQAVQVVDPKTLKATNSTEVALATIADLSDPKFVEIASKPHRFNLPYRSFGAYGLSPAEKPTWQIFRGKIAKPLVEENRFLEEEKWASHILVPGNEWRHWALSYEAGSAAAVNMYLEAAQELQLTPVTTSQLHHELVLRKLKRVFAEDDNKIELIDNAERKKFRTIFAQGEIIRLFGDLFPISRMDSVSLAEVLKFRDETEELRHKFITDIDDALRVIDSDPKTAEYDKEVIEVIRKLKIDFEKLEKDLTNVRDKVLPSFTKALMYGTAGGSAMGALVSFLGGLSTATVVSASALTIIGPFLAEAIDLWNEKRKILKSQPSSVSYLASISKLVKP